LGGIIILNNSLTVRDAAPSATNYNIIRRLNDWPEYLTEDTQIALKNSIFWVTVYDGEQLVGMGRVLGDTRTCFYIQDVMVTPKRQKEGIGSIIMNQIMEYIHLNAIKNAYIGLMSRKGVEGFYEKYQFVSRPNNTMGHGMVVPNFSPKNMGTE
jgi:GNAT superfamily N-acetyltransferase